MSVSRVAAWSALLLTLILSGCNTAVLTGKGEIPFAEIFEDRTDQYHIEQLPVSEFKGQPVQLEVKPEGLQTRQWLPWPESLRQGLVQEAQLRAEQELEYNQAALKVIGGAEKAFRDQLAIERGTK